MILAEPHAALLNELHALAASGEFATNCLRMRATASHCLKAVDVAGTTLILPLQGQKRMRDGARELRCERGHLILVPGPRRLDMENIPDTDSGEYTAVAIAIHARDAGHGTQAGAGARPQRRQRGGEARPGVGA
ncbi:MAG: hypothetical protein IPN40_10745 [Uliginosibacterium sp.]|nr:hypothetical protein [Uliginosibacterium sp.]